MNGILPNPLLGADPEFFILGNDEPISADKFFGKKKRNASHQIFFDGFQAEINLPPNTCRELFTADLGGIIREAFSKIVFRGRKLGIKDFKIFPVATIRIKPEHLIDVDEECLRFGCSPDAILYSSEERSYPDGRKHFYRYAGGHIHVGLKDRIVFLEILKDNKLEFLRNSIKLMDRLGGLLSVVLSPYEDERQRRKYYGQAGCYRLNNHGIEYRTPSSFWIIAPPLVSVMTASVRNAVKLALSKIGAEILSEPTDEEIVKIINNCDRKSAFDYLSIYRRILIKHIPKGLKNYFPLCKKSIFYIIKRIHERGGYRYFFNPAHITNYYKTRILGNGIHQFSQLMIKYEDKEIQYMLDGGEDKWIYTI